MNKGNSDSDIDEDEDDDYIDEPNHTPFSNNLNPNPT